MKTQILLYLPSIICCTIAFYIYPFMKWLIKKYSIENGYTYAVYDENVKKYKFTDDFNINHYLSEEYKENISELYIRYSRINPDKYFICKDFETEYDFENKCTKIKKIIFIISIIFFFVFGIISRILGIYCHLY